MSTTPDPYEAMARHLSELLMSPIREIGGMLARELVKTNAKVEQLEQFAEELEGKLIEKGLL